MIWVLEHDGSMSFAFNEPVTSFTDLIERYKVVKVNLKVTNEMQLEEVFEELNMNSSLLNKHGLRSLSVNDVIIYYDRVKKCYRAFKVQSIGWKELDFVRVGLCCQSN